MNSITLKGEVTENFEDARSNTGSVENGQLRKIEPIQLKVTRTIKQVVQESAASSDEITQTHNSVEHTQQSLQ